MTARGKRGAPRVVHSNHRDALCATAEVSCVRRAGKKPKGGFLRGESKEFGSSLNVVLKKEGITMQNIYKPVYAPSIVKALFRAHPMKFYSAEKIAADTAINVKQVRVICQRLVADKWLKRCITKWRNKTQYFWYPEI